MHGQLPFDLIGMDEEVASVTLSLSGGRDTDTPIPSSGPMSTVLEDLELYAQSLKDKGVALASIREVRVSLEGQINRMDNLESDFDRIAERSLLSSSRLPISRRRSTRIRPRTRLVQPRREEGRYDPFSMKKMVLSRPKFPVSKSSSGFLSANTNVQSGSSASCIRLVSR
ncbi:hypothetical protein B0F90DRAFT_363530 [Multifurca ochricompacta]|uniref:Uncharacterized protein n=1 Tax=Multifurca ochricompacta TaxID=376703 RepID=A0AAD4LVC1_9AGAM|nr:hypothetical protein B0F90DRAFT_363530 [Multifurca ochricompacta]